MKAYVKTLPKAIAAAVLAFAAVALNVRWILGPGASTASANTTAAASAGLSGAPRTARDSSPMDPVLHLSRLALAENTEYQGTGRDIFRSLEPEIKREQATGEKPAQPEKTKAASQPQLALTFFGFSRKENSPKKIFLSQDGDVFIGSEGDIVDRRYKILRIAPESVDVEDLLDSSTHTLALQQK